MPTHPLQAVPAAAVDIVAALSLSTGDEVAVQVRGRRPARYAEAASAPADGNEQLPGAWAYFTVANTPIWYWCPHADGTAVSVNT